MRAARTLLITGTAAVLAFAPDAQARRRVEVTPYLELDVTALTDLKNGGGTQVYAGASAGVDASIVSQRAEAQLSYRYTYRFGLSDNTGDSQVHSGLARARVEAVPNLLNIEGGALATRVRTDSRGAAPLVGLGNPSNVSQLYSFYVGPTLATRVDDLDLTAFYRFGYNKADTQTDLFVPGVLNGGQISGGSRTIGAFDEATTHVAGASVGMRSGRLPFGWTVSGAYAREDAGQLDAQFESKTVRGDVVVPVSPTVAIVGGVGYEKIQSSQRDPLLDGAGIPVVDRDGRFVTNPASPRRLSYDESGFIWDTGVLWRPSPRTSLEARVGRRYGSISYTGSFSWAPTPHQAVQVGVYDGVTTFGQQIGTALTRVPTRFVVQRDPFDSQFNGCVFGASGAGAGTCLTPALQSIAAGTFRSRGVSALWSYSRGSLNGGVALGYSQRRFFLPPVGGFVVDRVRDHTVYAQGFVGYTLDDRSGVQGSVYANWYDPGLTGAGDVFGVGATGTYYRTFADRLNGSASLGLYSTDVDGLDSSLVGAAQLGLRYSF